MIWNLSDSGHKSSRSPGCGNHNLTKQEVFKMNLGQPFHASTRKILLKKCVNQDFRSRLKRFIILFSRNVWVIVFRAQLFVNYYIARRFNQQKINRCIFRQQFWYFVCQMINDKRMTRRTNLPPIRYLYGMHLELNTEHSFTM